TVDRTWGTTSVDSLKYCIFCVSFSDTIYLHATDGQDAILRCQSTSSSPVSYLSWETRAREKVFYSSKGVVYNSVQNAKFRGRVSLLSPSMTNGTGSLIIRNISLADAGLYRCVISAGENAVVMQNNVITFEEHSTAHSPPLDLLKAARS
uniref:Ig-like domain-containing protein n=1 Tax=Oreochromis aureus TaxID=47969 RepID=A0A668RVF9_OREAU